MADDDEQQQQEEFLRQIQSVCESSDYDELILNLQKENLLDRLKICCRECNILKGEQVQESISCLLLHITKEVHHHLQLDSDHNDEGENESVNSHGEVVCLMTMYRVILSCLVKSSLSDCSQEAFIIHKTVLKEVAIDTLILCASHAEKWPWTSERTRATAKDILDLLCDGCRVGSVPVLLSGSDATTSNKEQPLLRQELLSGVLDVLQSRTTAWSPLPHVVCWCVMRVQYPHVGKHFSRLLPLLLKLIDDHQVINKVIGVQCLHYVMKNMNTAELIWYGRIDVVFEVLHRLLYLNEPVLLNQLYPCMLHVLQVMNSKSGGTDKRNKEFDSFMEVILTSMEYESNLQLRRVHAVHLEKVVAHMQINLLRYLKRFLSVVLSYLAVHDDSKEDIRINVLQALKTAILHVWPRIAGHADVILEALLKLVVDCFDSSSECKDQLLNTCMECIIVLNYCLPNHVKKCLYTIKEDVCHAQLQEYIGKVLKNCDDKYASAHD